MKPSRPRTLVLVSHTHWDPEWYSTYQQYRIRLVTLMDKLLELLETDRQYKHFMFDGQVSAIDDYLEICPENEPRIRKQVSAGRLLIGPWWIMPEEFMVSPESHIRNLLLGRKRGRELGGVMPIGYLCDIPGHLSQMPQILRGFGIEAAAAFRGIAGCRNTGQDLFRWRAPDGSEVLMAHLVHSYGNAAFMSRAPDPVAAVREIRDAELPQAAGSVLLLMEGTDHQEASPAIPALIRRVNRGLDGDVLIHGTLPRYVEMAEKAARRLKTHRGELRATRSSRIFASGMLASRMGIKTANRAGEVLLEQWAEPFAAFASLLGVAYPAALLWKAWRFLLQNDFHDVIYGGHIDEVTADAQGRYRASAEIAHWLTQEALHGITRRIDTRGFPEALVVFNPCARAVSGVVEFDYYDNAFALPEKRGREVALLDGSGALVPCQLGRTEQVVKSITRKGVMEYNKVAPSRRHSLSFLAQDVPPCGYRTYGVAYLTRPELARRMPGTDLKAGARECENRHLKVRFNANGTFDVFDKQTRRTTAGLNGFEDTGDSGDLYFYRGSGRTPAVTSRNVKARITRTAKGPVKAEYRIAIPLRVPARSGPEGRSRRRVLCPITTVVTLAAGSRRIDIRTTIDNRAADHRIRVLFPTGIRGDTCDVDSGFDVVRRRREPTPRPDWTEPPLGYQPQRQFVCVEDKARGIAVFNKGLPQVQVGRDGSIRVTLLRCVGHMRKFSIPEWRTARTMDTWPTPAAQEPGSHRFEYAVYPYAGDWREAEVPGEALAFNAGLKAMQADEHAGPLPRAASFLGVSSGALMLSSVKRAEDGKGVIVRLCNLSGKTTTDTLDLFAGVTAISRVDMAEETKGGRRGLAWDRRRRRLRVTAGPHEVMTVKLERNDER